MTPSVLVTLHYKDREWDLELPAQIPVGDLLKLLQAALDLQLNPAELELTIEPHGARIGPQDTLISWNVLDGARLRLDRPKIGPRLAAETSSLESPQSSWRPIQSPDSQGPASTGFAWKQLED